MICSISYELSSIYISFNKEDYIKEDLSFIITTLLKGTSLYTPSTDIDSLLPQVDKLLYYEDTIGIVIKIYNDTNIVLYGITDIQQ